MSIKDVGDALHDQLGGWIALVLKGALGSIIVAGVGFLVNLNTQVAVHTNQLSVMTTAIVNLENTNRQMEITVNQANKDSWSKLALLIDRISTIDKTLTSVSTTLADHLESDRKAAQQRGSQ